MIGNSTSIEELVDEYYNANTEEYKRYCFTILKQCMDEFDDGIVLVNSNGSVCIRINDGFDENSVKMMRDGKVVIEIKNGAIYKTTVLPKDAMMLNTKEC